MSSRGSQTFLLEIFTCPQFSQCSPPSPGDKVGSKEILSPGSDGQALGWNPKDAGDLQCGWGKGEARHTSLLRAPQTQPADTRPTITPSSEEQSVENSMDSMSMVPTIPQGNSQTHSRTLAFPLPQG